MVHHIIAIGLGFLLLGTAASVEPHGKEAISGGRQKDAPTTRPSAQHEPGTVPGVEPRDPKTDAKLIDLTDYYTLALNEDASGAFGYTLEALPRGVQKLGGVQYDLRGVVQVSSQEFGRGKAFPEAVMGIKVGLKCAKLSFLHASRWTEDRQTRIGSYVINYANGKTREVPIVFGVDLRDWRPMHDPDAKGKGPAVGWKGQDNKGREIVLFQTTWTNSLPDVEITSIDMVSAMKDAAPFLVAVTAQ